MKRLSLPVFLLILIGFAACAHQQAGPSSPLSAAPLSSPPAGAVGAAVGEDPDHGRDPVPDVPLLARDFGGEDGDRAKGPGNRDLSAEEEVRMLEKEAAISDPLEPFNRAMFQFNDKVYFWVLKPLAQGYKTVVPETPRKSVKNFFSNLAFPIRFVGSLLQGDVQGAVSEFGRFAVNTLWGVGGLLDPASSEQLDIPKRDADFGQTLGVYGLGQGPFIIWPLLGPSSVRDTVGLVGDFFLDPISYLSSSWYDFLWLKAYNEVNDASLRIGDYEAFLEAAIDPYVALRDAYAQYRWQKVLTGRGGAEPAKPAGVRK